MTAHEIITAECTMVNAAGKVAARGLMVIAHVDLHTNRATDWPADRMALFFEPAGEDPNPVDSTAEAR